MASDRFVAVFHTFCNDLFFWDLLNDVTNTVFIFGMVLEGQIAMLCQGYISKSGVRDGLEKNLIAGNMFTMLELRSRVLVLISLQI